MKLSIILSCALAALLGPLILQGQTGSGSSECRDDVIPPQGTPIYRGEYLNPERDFQLRLPDGVVAFGNCASSPAEGVRISLSNPASGKLDDDHPGWDVMAVWAFKRSSTPKEQLDRALHQLKEDNERDHVTDVEILPATEISFGSLTWVDVKASLVQPPYGKLFYEMMFAKDPRKDIDYQIGMICSAVLCEKERPLFKSVAEGFTYTPVESAEKSRNTMDADSNRQ
jgi:hypothetical protein